MRVVIDRSRCQGHARCNAVAEKWFVLDSDGYIAVDGFDVPAGEEALAMRAARACPERAISVVDDHES